MDTERLKGHVTTVTMTTAKSAKTTTNAVLGSITAMARRYNVASVGSRSK